MQNCYWSVRCDAEYIQVFVFIFFFCSKCSNLSLLCNHIAKEWFTRPVSSLHVNINVVQYRGKKIYKCCFIWFFHFLKNCNDVYVMYCLPVGCNNKKKKNRFAEDLFPLDQMGDLNQSSNLAFGPSQNSKVKYSKAFQGSNIPLSSSSMQPPVASRVLALWDWRLFNLLSRLTPIINLTYSHQHGSYHSHASSAS